MRRWPRIDEVAATLDFGRGRTVPVGRLATTSGRVFFQYDDALIASGFNPSPFMLRRDTSLQQGPSEFDYIPGLFDDSLPDGWTRLVVDRRFRQAGYDPASVRVLDRLALVGSSAIGAVVYAPSTELDEPLPELSVDDIACSISRALDGEDANPRLAERLAGSLGGARPKANVWYDEKRWSSKESAEATPWIVKFPSKTDLPDDGAIEFVYSELARLAGIEMPRTRLIPTASSPGYFAIERFDRNGDERYHFQSLGGLMHTHPKVPSMSYAGLFKVCARMAGPDHVEQLIRRMAFNVIMRNRDDHVKNHAFLMNHEGIWIPSPAFDVTYSPVVEHQLDIAGKGANVTVADMEDAVTEADCDAGSVGKIVSEVLDAVSGWSAMAATNGVSRAMIDEIEVAIRDFGVDE